MHATTAFPSCLYAALLLHPQAQRDFLASHTYQCSSVACVAPLLACYCQTSHLTSACASMSMPAGAARPLRLAHLPAHHCSLPAQLRALTCHAISHHCSLPVKLRALTCHVHSTVLHPQAQRGLFASHTYQCLSVACVAPFTAWFCLASHLLSAPAFVFMAAGAARLLRLAHLPAHHGSLPAQLRVLTCHVHFDL